MIAAARQRAEAGFILDLAQAIAAGMAGKEGWIEKQKYLIAKLKTGL
jgi:hypothetical protein